MADTRVVESVDEFIAVCAGEGIAVAALQSVDEVRPVLHGEGVTVGPVRRLTVIGYRAGLVVRAVVDESPRAVEERLKKLGFRTRSTRHNIG